MSVFKRKLPEGEILEDNRFASLNTNVPDLYPNIASAAKEVAAPKAAKKEKEKEVVVETAVEEVAEEAPIEFEKDAE